MNTLKYLIIVSVLVIGCKQHNALKRISSTGSTAESVYLTNDHQNNPVIVWTENSEGKRTLFFATSKDNGETFSEKISLPLTNDVATHAESMPKVAFKKDGTIIVVYEKKAPVQENKYAGSIHYVLSTDGGKSWTKESYIHNDTVAGRSRSYFDIAPLPDGEIGAAWLDIKMNNEAGRSVRFAKTVGSKFSNEMLIDSSACQCCRIDVYSDAAEKIHIAYRGFMKSFMGKTIRDMMLTTSADNGQSFSAPVRISEDNWAIDGCPHTGPSLCGNNEGLYCCWYTEGNGTGIYYSFKRHTDSSFRQRQLISGSGRFPQSVADESRVVMVWQESRGEENQRFSQVLYQVMGEGTTIKTGVLTPQNVNAYLPVVTRTDDGLFLLAFLMETVNGAGVFTGKL